MATSKLRDRAAAANGTVATRDETGPDPQLRDLIARLQPEMARALPRHLEPDRLARIALTEVSRTPLLAQTTSKSFMGALMTCAQLGLEPGAATGEAYLIPRKNRGVLETTLVVGYQGYVKLFWQHPLARHLTCEAVYAGDDFDYAYGLDPFLRHKPQTGASTSRAVSHYYAAASLTSGAQMFVVLSPAQVRELRNGKVGSSGDIPDPMRWMERKTVLKQLLKLLPKSTGLVQALANDETVRTDLSVEAVDAPGPVVVVEQVEATGQADAMDTDGEPVTPVTPVDVVDAEDVPAHRFLWGEDAGVCAQCGEPEDADCHGGRA